MKVISGREICQILRQHGFEQVRQRGSHIIMQKKSPGGSEKKLFFEPE
jgi:predicted RNA binding protein YcfA (HicA-like mRNA interferase family)